jgi:hypothetical protein
MIELLWIAPKNESRQHQTAEAVNCKYNTYFNPAERGELRVVS